MTIDIANISLPVTVTTGNTNRPKQSFISITETFSQEYKGRVSNRLLLQLGSAFASRDGTSHTAIKDTIRAFSHFCKFCILNSVSSFEEVSSKTIRNFLSYLKCEYSYNERWSKLYYIFKSCTQYEWLTHVVWPVIPRPPKEASTIAHPPEVFEAIIDKLKIEIDRILAKVGLFDEAMRVGKILTIQELDSYRSMSSCPLTSSQLEKIRSALSKSNITQDAIAQMASEYGVTPGTIRCYGRRFKKNDLPSPRPEIREISAHDLIKTLRHFLPEWPVRGALPDSYSTKTWRVYNVSRGVLLGEYYNKDAAVSAAKLCAGVVVYGLVNNYRADLNPGETILVSIKTSSSILLANKIKSVAPSVTELIDTYFPTSYDLTCVLMYWVCMTGWNLETVRSVRCSDVGFGLDIPERNPMDLFSPNHAILAGTQMIKERGINAGRRNATLISGEKRRAQPEGKPKIFTHVSEKEEIYSLINVLSKYYQLTLPLRLSLTGSENDCILVGTRPYGIGKKMVCYGPSDSSILDPLVQNAPRSSSKFFRRHEIFERLPNGEQQRLSATNAMILRTSFESYLASKGVPIEARQEIMGHNSMNTTSTSYGAEKESISRRRRCLREKLINLEGKAFRGELMPYEPEHKRRPDKIVQLFTHLDNAVFICKNRTNPTWPGSDEYIRGGYCTHFDECLFCEQCLVTIDSLPFLLRWKKDIETWLSEVGFAFVGDKVLLRRQAIEEILEICHRRGGEWFNALINAETIENDPNFTTPPLGYRYADGRDN